jgi:glycosyltransferase involved in cell wall biosynthesis
MGRMIPRKGVHIAISTCESIKKKIILCGQGGKLQPDGTLKCNGFEIKASPLWEYRGFASIEARKKLMAEAIAVICPTTYIEPFCGVHVEAMLAGTPVITTDFGVFPSTVINGVNGYRCNTLQEFVDAAKVVTNLDHAKVRATAEKFLTPNVAPLYQRWFDDLHAAWEAYTDKSKAGWHRLRADDVPAGS